MCDMTKLQMQYHVLYLFLDDFNYEHTCSFCQCTADEICHWIRQNMFEIISKNKQKKPTRSQNYEKAPQKKRRKKYKIW